MLVGSNVKKNYYISYTCIKNNYIYLDCTLIHSKMNKHLYIIFTSDLWCLYMSNKRLLSQQHVNNVAK